MIGPCVVAVSRSPGHTFSKAGTDRIVLIGGIGVEGDAHAGTTVKHRSRVARDPTQPNLRQVHLMHAELFAELAAQGFTVGAGELGENVTTAGVRLLELPTDTLLRLGATAVVRITGLRNPCGQINGLQDGLMAALLGRAPDGALVRRAGVMAVAVEGGVVCRGDPIEVVYPDAPHRPLEPV